MATSKDRGIGEGPGRMVRGATLFRRLDLPAIMKITWIATALLVGWSLTAAPAQADDGPCAGTPENHCAPLCDTGDVTDCVAWPVFPCIYVEDGIVVCP